MTKVKLNPFLMGLRGAVGDLVFRHYGDEVVISKRPDMSKVVWSEKQVAHRERFRAAMVYGRLVMADEGLKAVYKAEAVRRGKPVFSVPVKDFMNAPVVDEVDLSGYGGKVGDEVMVRAHDDFEVVGVEVCVMRVGGEVVEEGEAMQVGGVDGLWVYVARVAVEGSVRVRAVARDRPGNEGQLIIDNG